MHKDITSLNLDTSKKIKNKKKLKNIVHRETRNERRDLTASLRVLIND